MTALNGGPDSLRTEVLGRFFLDPADIDRRVHRVHARIQRRSQRFTAV